MLNGRHNSSGMPAYIRSTGLVNHVNRMFLPYSCTDGCLGWAKDAAPASSPSTATSTSHCIWKRLVVQINGSAVGDVKSAARYAECHSCATAVCRVGFQIPPSANGLRGPPTRKRPSRVIDGVPPNQSLGKRQVHPCGPECLDSQLPASGGREAGRLRRTLGHRTSGYWFPASLPAEHPTG